MMYDLYEDHTKPNDSLPEFWDDFLILSSRMGMGLVTWKLSHIWMPILRDENQDALIMILGADASIT